MKFKGEVTFEIRVNVMLPFVKFSFPVAGSSMRRGKSNTITWTGGSSNEQLEIELLQNNNRVRSLTTTANSGRYTWNIPKDAVTGKDFQIRITSKQNGSNSSTSPSFAIKNKIPWALKLAPVVVVGAVVGVIVAGGSGGSEPIPNPPDPN